MKLFVVLILSALIYVSTAAPRAKRDLKDDLVKKAAEVEKSAIIEIEKLKSQNKTALAAGLEIELIRIKAIAEELKTTTGPEALRLIEEELSTLVTRLANEVYTLELKGSPEVQLLIARAVQLEAYIAMEVSHLKKKNQKKESENLQKEADQLKNMINLLKETQSDAVVKESANQLKLLEARVEVELNRLGFKPPPTQPTQPARPTTHASTHSTKVTTKASQKPTTTQTTPRITVTTTQTTPRITVTTTQTTPRITVNTTQTTPRITGTTILTTKSA